MAFAIYKHTSVVNNLHFNLWPNAQYFWGEESGRMHKETKNPQFLDDLCMLANCPKIFLEIWYSITFLYCLKQNYSIHS